MAKRILFISKSGNSASTRYRALQYFPLLERAGYEASHQAAAGGPANYLHTLYRAAAADIVVVLRKTFPKPFLWLLRKVSRKLVFDFDDAIFCNTDGSPSSTRMRRFTGMLTVCDHVLAGNNFLARRAAQFSSKVTVLPTSVDAARYACTPEKSQKTVDLVWIGSRSTRKYLLEVLPALRLAAMHEPSLRLKIIADFDLPDAGLPTLAVPWSAETESAAIASSHIGIAPMWEDDWSRGKCALKILQYMASGLPVISSDVGANAEAVISGRTGYLVNSDEAWCERIVQLAGDRDLCHQMGAEGRQLILSDYSIQPVFYRMASVFEGLC